MRPLTEQQEIMLKNLVYERGMFVGRDRLFKFMVNNHFRSHPTKRQTEHWLKQQEWHQRFHKTRKRKSTRPILTNKAEAIYQVDLSDMISYRERGFQYIVALIDTFSKKAYTKALKNKRSETVADAVREIIDRNDLHPQACTSDNGQEFVGREFEEMLAEKGINHIVTNPYSPTQNSVVERFNGTIKRSLYQSMHAKSSRKWVDALPVLTSNYNSLWHRSIRMTPNQAADMAKRVEVAATLRRNAQGKYNATPVMFQVSDRVRLRNIRKKYDKSSVPTFGADVFQIVEVREPSAEAIGLTVYKIAKEADDGTLEEPLKGAYNDSQLLRIINVEHHPVPPAPEPDSEDDEFPDGYPESEDDEPVQRRRIDQRELDDLLDD
jgi:transposase InsO family protein